MSGEDLFISNRFLVAEIVFVFNFYHHFLEEENIQRVQYLQKSNVLLQKNQKWYNINNL